MASINGWGLTADQYQLAEERRREGVEKVREVKRGWIPFSGSRDPGKELERFRKAKPDFYHSVISQYGDGGGKLDISNVCFMRALELIEALGETHYCFLHGQSFDQYITMLYTTKKVEAKDPSLAGKYRKFFRTPESVAASPRNVKDFVEKNPKIHDSDLGNEILSVSGYPLSRRGYESAFFFFVNRFSFNPPSTSVVGLAPIKCSISPALGALHVIAVPKEWAENEEQCGVYNAFPFGKPTGASIELLKRFQKLEDVKDASDQYRLLTRMLCFNPEVITVSLTEMAKSEKKECYREIERIVEKEQKIT